MVGRIILRIDFGVNISFFLKFVAYLAAHNKIIENFAEQSDHSKEIWNAGTSQLIVGLIVQLEEEGNRWAFIGCNLGQSKVFRIPSK